MRFIDKDHTPNDWTSYKINHYIEDYKGGASLKPADFSECGFPVIPKKAIQQGNKLVISQPTYCTHMFAEKNTRSIVDSSYTITTLRDLVPTGPTIGTAVNFNTDERYILAQGVYGLRLKPSIDKNYFAYVSNADFYRKVMRRVMVGSTQVHIRTSEYLSLDIQLPPLPEQRKIAKILSTWDKAISTTERLIDNSKQQKKALMQQLLTGKKRLLDDLGRPFEGEWEEAPLKECVTFLNGKRKPIKQEERASMQGQYPYYGATGIIDYVNNYIFDDELILLGEDGENILSRVLPHVFLISGKTWVNNHAHVMKAKEGVDTKFLCMYLEKLDYKKFNSGSAQPKINKAVCEKIPVCLPSLEEQIKISTVLTNADQEIDLLEKQLANLKQEKRALMQQLLTGKRRVKPDDTAVA